MSLLRWSRNALLWGLASLGTSLAIASNEAQSKPAAPGIAFTNVNVVDVELGQIIPERTVIVRGDRIAVVQAVFKAIPDNVTTVAADGKFLIPGLWDMHAHVADEGYLALFVGNGVIGVRDMGGGLDEAGDGCESVKISLLRKWRSEVLSGRRLGPQLVIAGPTVSGTGWPTSLPARTPNEAKAAVRAIRRQGADFIKVYDGIPLAAYRALALEAKRSRLPFGGHAPEEVGPLVAIRAGQRSIEHIRDALLVCFTGDSAELERFFSEDRWGEPDRRWGRIAYASCSSIITALQTSEVWLTPTLAVEKAKVSVEEPRYVGDPRRRALPKPVRDGYAKYVKGKLAQSPAERASEHLWWRTQQKLVRRMNGLGVKILAGTDSACEGGLPGRSLHLELEELVAAGLSPLEALRAATIEPARYFGRRDEGRVLPGYRANLLLLDANPLADIKNTQGVWSVVLAGRLLRRDQLERLAYPQDLRR
jgi:imidazolonepropionase-like amidohydrolase